MLLQVENLRLQTGERVLVEALDFRARAGEMWAVLGANGSGKTTLLHALTGLVSPSAGRVLWRGREVQHIARRELAREVALLPQREEASFWGSVSDYVMLARYAQGDADSPEMRQRAHALLAEAQLATLAQRGLHTLSGGELQRARIAQLWLQDATLLCLDEVLQHLDPRHQLGAVQQCARLTREQQRLVFLVLHDNFWALRHCDHALLLYGDGRASAGAAAQLATRENLAHLYSVEPSHFEFAALA